MPLEKLYSIDDAGIQLGGISRCTLEGWLSAGRVKRTKVGRRTMISESELQRLLEQSAAEASSPKRGNLPAESVAKVA